MADDSALKVAHDPAAPADERFDAQVDLTKSTGALQQQLIPPEDLMPIFDHINSQYDPLAKGLQSGVVVPFPPKHRGGKNARGGQSVFLDDFQIVAQGSFWDRPGLLGFDSMRHMVDQTPLLAGIVLTRIRQVNRFCRPQMGQDDVGFKICHVDPKIELNPTQQEATQLLQRFMVNCGWETNPRARKRLRRDSFSQFMAKSVRDTLTLDACPIETEFKRDRNLGLDGFYALDGATIRLCTEEGYEGNDEIFALQVIEGNIRTAYTYDDLVYEVRNPRTDIRACGYGYSETEMLIRVVTYLLNAMTYNGTFFDKNSIPRGILNLYGNYSQSDIAIFKRYWNSMVGGIQNAHNLPVMVSKDQESKADFTEIGGQMDEMAFAKWVTFLTSVSCAIYGIAPEEVSMESFATQSKGIGGNDTEEKLVSSNDKGLRPLLGFYEGMMSDFIVQVFSEEYMFKFVGLDQEAEDKRFEMKKLTATLNEGRAAQGMDPIEGPLGDAPLNPNLIAPWMQIEGIGQEEEDFGDPNQAPPAEGEEPPPGEGEEGDDAPPAATDPQPGQEPDFGRGEEAPMAKSLTDADFGLPPIYRFEV